MALQSLKNNHSENVTRYFEDKRRTIIKFILQTGTFRFRTGWPFLTNESALRLPVRARRTRGNPRSLALPESYHESTVLKSVKH